MKKKRIDPPPPELTFPTVVYGRKTVPIDLRIFLYKGGAAENYRTIFNKISAGNLGQPIQKRIKLVQCIHDELNAALASGKSPVSINGCFKIFRIFFKFADEQCIQISIETVELAYRKWVDHLHDRAVKKEIAMTSSYAMALCVGNILSAILETSKSLIAKTPLRHDKREISIATDEQNLEDIFKFGHLLIDIVNCLTSKVIYGKLPVKIELRNGISWNEWSGLKSIEKLKTFRSGKKLTTLRSAWADEHSLRTRSPLINLRLQAELLIFIAQTGINLAQARQLKIFQASYTSSIDGYQVRAYKSRKRGEVSFEIFSQYRDHFEKYLRWRKEIFQNTNDLLFPFIDRQGVPTLAVTTVRFERIRNICKMANINPYSPSALRKTRINWLLRQSRNSDLTADQAQHTKQVLHKIYEKPSLQVAKIEFIQFWKKNDPTLKNISPAPALGVCDGIPTPIEKMPPGLPKPDCIHPSGCLFCEHHRDIDSEDYVWSIASMKHLNAILIGKYKPIEKNQPDMGSHIELVLEMLVEKLKWFKLSNEKRKEWVYEALDRCNEGDFHPHWGYLIESIEI